MFIWQLRTFLVLLLTFSGLNLIRSDCGADVDRFNGDFCVENRNLRRIDDYNIDQSRRIQGAQHLERIGSYLEHIFFTKFLLDFFF